MWKCKCGESHEDSFDICWSCGADHSKTTSKNKPSVPPLLAVVADREKERGEVGRPILVVISDIKLSFDSVLRLTFQLTVALLLIGALFGLLYVLFWKILLQR